MRKHLKNEQKKNLPFHWADQFRSTLYYYTQVHHFTSNFFFNHQNWSEFNHVAPLFNSPGRILATLSQPCNTLCLSSDNSGVPLCLRRLAQLFHVGSVPTRSPNYAPFSPSLFIAPPETHRGFSFYSIEKHRLHRITQQMENKEK